MDMQIAIDFSAEEMAAINAWIERTPDPKPSHAEAVRAIVAGRLGSHRPSTILPNEVTGRDIFS
jgi:hypothetical protein